MSSLSAQDRDLIESQDTDGLLRLIDSICSRSDWVQLAQLRSLCDAATERGRQLWGVISHIDYRIALEAPDEIAAGVVRPGAARFALGPLTEVVASTHEWSALRHQIADHQLRAYVAQERVIRGEDLSDDPLGEPSILELPMKLAPWEPQYALATYEASEAAFPAPAALPMQSRNLESTLSGSANPDHGRGLNLDLYDSLRSLVQPWTSESNGRCEVALAEGGIDDAITILAPTGTRVFPAELAPVVAAMAWAAANGGAFGRRRGSATGRFSALWVTAEIAGLAWPIDIDRAPTRLADLDCAFWSPPLPSTGWELRIAIANRRTGLAAAIDACDAA